MRRRWFLVAAIAALTACSVGCSTLGPSPWPTALKGPVTITILSGTDTSISPGSSPLPGATGMYSELVDWWNTYEEPITHIQVRLDTIDGGATLENSEILSAAQSGDADYDIYNLDNEWVSEFAVGNYIRSLQGHVPSGFIRQPLESGQNASGQQYAVPFTTDVGLLYYRSDLVPDASSLTSFTEVLKEAQQVQGRDPAMTVGYAGQFAKYEGLTVNLLEIISGEFPGAIGKDGTINNSADVVEVLQQLIDKLGDGVIPSSEVSDYTESQAYQAFVGGQAVFMRNWPIYYNQLTAPQSGSDIAADNFGVVPLPFPSVLGGQDLAISTTSKDPSAAMQVIDFLTSAQAERCLFAVGGFPATRTSAYADSGQLPTGYQVAGQPAVAGHPLCGSKTGRQLNISNEILTGISHAFPRPVTPYYSEYSTVLQDDVSTLLESASEEQNDNVSGTVSNLVTDLQDALSGHAAPLRPRVTLAFGYSFAYFRAQRPKPIVLQFPNFGTSSWGEAPASTAFTAYRRPAMMRATMTQ